MKNVIRLEELAMLLASMYGLFYFNVEWWYYIVLFLGPDISMLFYLGGNKIGAIGYNIFHHKAIALTVLICGFIFHNQALQIAGLILFGHSSMDRFMGYGLKTFEGFSFTHLGKIGKQS